MCMRTTGGGLTMSRVWTVIFESVTSSLCALAVTTAAGGGMCVVRMSTRANRPIPASVVN